MIDRVWIGSLPIDKVDFEGALSAIARLVESGAGGTVFTPNVDHVVIADRNPRFTAAYHRVSLSLIDGTPLLWAAHLLGDPPPEKVSGSDLVLPLMRLAAGRRWRVFLLGGAAGVADQAAARLAVECPGIVIAGTASPRIDLSGGPAERLGVATEVAKTNPDLILVAFGAPKQEIFSDEVIDLVRPAVLVCVGAGLDFLAGVAKRSPAWMSKWGIEWLHRLAHEPRRLAGRYLLRDPRFAMIFLRQLLRGQPASRQAGAAGCGEVMAQAPVRDEGPALTAPGGSARPRGPA